MLNQMKPIFAMYILHILQGKASGFHIFISFLDSCKGAIFEVPWPIS